MRIGNLTTDYKDGKEMLERVNELKIFKVQENIDYIIGWYEVIYIYSEESIKEEHKNKMLAEGWELENKQECVYIYKDDKNSDNDIKVPSACYSKAIEGIYGVIYGLEETEGYYTSVETILNNCDISNRYNLDVLKSFMKDTGDEELAVRKAIEYKQYIESTENRYPELIMRLLRHIKGFNEYDISNDNFINSISEEEVYDLLRIYQDAHGNLSKTVMDWVQFRYNKDLN